MSDNIMHAKNIYLLLAREVLTDASDNMNSIIKIIDKFTFGVALSQLKTLGNQIPALPVTFAIASAWIFDSPLKRDTIIKLRVNIEDPTGKDLSGPEQESLIPKGQQKLSMNFVSSMLPVGSSGTYKLHATLGSTSGATLANATYLFDVELVDAITRA